MIELDKQNINEKEFESEVKLIYSEIIKKPEVNEALELLDELPTNLFYHDKDHTLDVIKETILFAVADRAAPEVIELEAIAAAWHDVGHAIDSEKHESIGVDLFKKSKAYKKMTDEQRNEVIANILDTQIIIRNDKPHLQKQKSKYGYVLDADISNFGRGDFFVKGEMIAKESGLDLSDPETKKKFLKFTIDLLKNHEWQTNSAKNLRQIQKEINLRESERKLLELS